MSYYSNEDAKNLILLEIDNRKKALELYQLVIPVVQKFDGKVLNKRLETALRQTHKDLRVDWRGQSYYIQMSCFDNRSVKSVNTDSCGYASWNYIETDYVSLNTHVCPSIAGNYEPDRIMVTENNRIKSEALIKALESGKEYLIKQIKELEDGLDKVDEWQKRMEEIKQSMSNLKNEIPYAFVNYYHGLNHYIH